MSLTAVATALSGKRRMPTWAYRSLSIALYFFLTSWLYGWALFDNSKIIGGAGADMAQEVWFLAWPAYAITHGHSLFYTNAMNYPHGLNLMANTSMPLLGVLGAPITWIFGPVVTYTLFMRLGFILSAASAQFVARRIGLSRPASLAAGLIYGFSTAQLVEGHGHLFLVFAPIPPLIFYAVYCLFIGRWSPMRAGLTVGILSAADFLISAERSLMTVIGLFVVLFAAAIVCWRRITKELLLRVGRGALWTGASALILLALPLFEMQGKDHVSGAAHPWIQGYHTDLAGIFFPGQFTWLDVFGLKPSIVANVKAIWENGAYVGIPLAIVLLVVVIRAWRKPLVLIGAIATALVVGLSFGEVLTVDGHLVHFFGVHSHLPYKFLTHVKYIQNIEPVRYMYIAWIGIALLGAYGLDLMLRWRKGGSGRDGLLRTAAVTAVCATVVLTLVPGETYNMPNTVVPSWITSAQAHREIPNGSVVLFYPYPTLLSNHALLDQAMGNFYFKIIGGEGLIGGKGGVNVGVTPLAPLALPSAFIRIWQQNPTLPIIGDPITLPPLPPNDTTTVAAFRYFVQLHHVRALIVETQLDAHWAQLMPYLRSAFGSPVSHDHGEIYVWLFAHKAFS